VIYDFSKPSHPFPGITTKYTDGSIEAEVYVLNNLDDLSRLETFVHESSHAVRAARGHRIDTLGDEYLAHRREMLFMNLDEATGLYKRPSLKARQKLFDYVRQEYSELPEIDVPRIFRNQGR
jgi:hypothetical protein